MVLSPISLAFAAASRVVGNSLMVQPEAAASSTWPAVVSSWLASTMPEPRNISTMIGQLSQTERRPRSVRSAIALSISALLRPVPVM
ncbi:MAG: hypothetical protein ACHQAQ_12045 [Hyphomicrobiales bacterium]